jgi:hypothetical protein
MQEIKGYILALTRRGERWEWVKIDSRQKVKVMEIVLK